LNLPLKIKTENFSVATLYSQNLKQHFLQLQHAHLSPWKHVYRRSKTIQHTAPFTVSIRLVDPQHAYATGRIT
jgi:hypothetical protein